MKTTVTILKKIEKKIYVIFLLSALSLNLFCQIDWTKHPDNPVLTPGSPGDWDEVEVYYPHVIYYDNTFHMWYSGSKKDTTRIGHATSPDGITWTKDSNNPVVDVGPDGAWDDKGVYQASVLLVDDVFHMWYNGDQTDWGVEMNKFGHATSPDGISWTKDPNNPVLTTGPSGTWDDIWIYYCNVVYSDGTFHMWYSGYDGATGVRIGHATSPDGVAWIKDPLNPVMEFEGWEAPLVISGGTIYDDSIYHMWYIGGKVGETMIGYATSEDGSYWEKYGQPVLEKGPAGSWESQWIGATSVLFDSTDYKYKMWYTGSSMSDPDHLNIGYAESAIGPDMVEDHTTPEIFIYPNPSNRFLTIKTVTSDLNNIEITSLNGQLIYSSKMEGTSHEFDLSSFQKGVYLITVKSKDFVTTRKIIKL